MIFSHFIITTVLYLPQSNLSCLIILFSIDVLHLFLYIYSRYAIFDTPGQIEVFTWSASGAIITEALASSFATIVVYIIDTARSTSPVTFMSNMLYACSILYKTKLPFIVVLNKVIISLQNTLTIVCLILKSNFQNSTPIIKRV